MDYLENDGEEELSVTYEYVQARNLSLWKILAVVLRSTALIISVVAETIMQFAYTFFGKAEYDESRKRFAAEAGHAIETITGGE